MTRLLNRRRGPEAAGGRMTSVCRDGLTIRWTIRLRRRTIDHRQEEVVRVGGNRHDETRAGGERLGTRPPLLARTTSAGRSSPGRDNLPDVPRKRAAGDGGWSRARSVRARGNDISRPGGFDAFSTPPVPCADGPGMNDCGDREACLLATRSAPGTPSRRTAVRHRS